MKRIQIIKSFNHSYNNKLVSRLRAGQIILINDEDADNIIRKGFAELIVDTKNKVLKNWEDATEELTKEFLRIYFPNEKYDVAWFVSICIGDVYCVNEMYYFGQDDMITAIKYNATYEQLIEYYDASLEAGLENKKLKINFKNFIKWGWNLDKKR